VDPLTAPLKVVLSFFCYLFDKLRLQPSTIEGYRATLNPVCRARGLELSSSRVLSDLMASFRTQRPRKAPVLPEWDLAFVLYCLTKAPWEPLHAISLKRLTLKTFFLLLLASGRRRSDLGAIDVSRLAYAPDGSMILYPERGFAPKTRAATEGDKAFSPIIIPSLKDIVGQDEPDALLCPVRAMKVYVARTSLMRRGRNRLFISFQQNRLSNITNATLSVWVKLLVRSVYLESGAENRVIFRISAHQIRHIAMSLASRVGTPLESLIRAGMWTTPNVFLSHYLSDASELLGQTGRFRLAPIIAAQVKVAP
jgi:integrase